MKGDWVEIVVEAGGEVRTYEISATRAGRRVEVSIVRNIATVAEVTRGGGVVRTARFMASRVLALVEHPATRSPLPSGAPAGSSPDTHAAASAMAAGTLRNASSAPHDLSPQQPRSPPRIVRRHGAGRPPERAERPLGECRPAAGRIEPTHQPGRTRRWPHALGSLVPRLAGRAQTAAPAPNRATPAKSANAAWNRGLSALWPPRVRDEPGLWACEVSGRDRPDDDRPERPEGSDAGWRSPRPDPGNAGVGKLPRRSTARRSWENGS
jgi:hypothetical protein